MRFGNILSSLRLLLERLIVMFALFIPTRHHGVSSTTDIVGCVNRRSCALLYNLVFDLYPGI